MITTLMKTLIQQAVDLLKDGQVIALPTETVYGLAADATNDTAIQKIFELKGRPKTHPVAILIADGFKMKNFAIDIPDKAYKLATAFWQGPITLILKKAPHVSSVISGGRDTIGLRVPNHPITLEILKQFPRGLTAPSANRFGEESPIIVQQVKEIFDKKLLLIVDGGKCEVGIASTIIDLTVKPFKILREGTITSKMVSDTFV